MLNVLSRHWKNALHTGEAEQLPWKQELYKFLRNYRATPHTSTDKPPAELLFNRPFRTVLPELTQPVNDVTVRVKDEHSKLRMKQHPDAYAKAKSHKINIGDKVLIRTKTYWEVVDSLQSSCVSSDSGERFNDNCEMRRTYHYAKIIIFKGSEYTHSSWQTFKWTSPVVKVPNGTSGQDSLSEPRRNPVRDRHGPNRLKYFKLWTCCGVHWLLLVTVKLVWW